VRSFLEKPDTRTAEVFFRHGYLWNTMIMAVRGATLWSLAEAFHPAMMERFGRLRDQCSRNGVTPQHYLSTLYDDMPTVDFSRDIAERITPRIRVKTLDGVRWSDWGRPRRVIETLDEIGLAPTFPPAALAPEYAAQPEPMRVAV
jgi:mannose-1-phosphate guanylyltransferase